MMKLIAFVKVPDNRHDRYLQYYFRKYFTDWDLDQDDDPEIDVLINKIESMGTITLHDNHTGRTYIKPVFNHSGGTVWFRLHEHEASDAPSD